MPKCRILAKVLLIVLLFPHRFIKMNGVGILIPYPDPASYELLSTQ